MIYIVDAVMGAGKTGAAINYINSLPPDRKIIYVTPYLTEVDRILDHCAEKNLRTPGAKKGQHTKDIKHGVSKMYALKSLLTKGENIVTTHAMFNNFDDEVISLCYLQGYTLIMDEVANVVDEYTDYKPDDIDLLMKEFLDIDEETGKVTWRKDKTDYDGTFDEVHTAVENESLVYYEGRVMMWLFPVKVFEAFRDTYILTYMFNSQLQRYYYDFKGVEYKFLYVEGSSVDDFHFTEKPQTYKAKYNYRELINILDDPKMNEIGDNKTFLSWNWYRVNKHNDKVMGTLNKNMRNYFRNKFVMYKDGEYVKCDCDHALWTTFKDYKRIVGKGTSVMKGFVPCTARASNDWEHTTVVAYTVNRFVRPNISGFFNKHGIRIDEDGFALSEMLQFIWRSAIRNGQHITVYIPSKRMRDLLIGWIAENSKED